MTATPEKPAQGALPSSRKLGAIGAINVVLLGFSTITEAGSIFLLATRFASEVFSSYILSLAYVGALAAVPNAWFRIDFLRHLRMALDGKDVRARLSVYALLSVSVIALSAVALGSYLAEKRVASVPIVLLAGLASWMWAEMSVSLRISGRLMLPGILDLSARSMFFLSAIFVDRLDHALLAFAMTRLSSVLIGSFYFPWRQFGMPRDFIRHTREIVVDHWHILAATVSEYGLGWAGVLVLEVVGNHAAIGAVGLATRVLTPILVSFTALGDTILPKLLQGDHQDDRRFERGVAKALVAVLVGATVTGGLLALGALSVAQSLFGGELPEGTILIFAGCLPAIAFMPIMVLYKLVLASRKLFRETSLGMIYAGVTKVALSFLLLPIMGVYGICVAIVLSYAVYAGYYWLCTRRVVEMTPKANLFVPGLVLSSAAAASLAVGLAPAWTILIAILGIAVHWTTLRLGRIVDAEEVERVGSTGLPKIARQVLGWLTGFPSIRA